MFRLCASWNHCNVFLCQETEQNLCRCFIIFLCESKFYFFSVHTLQKTTAFFTENIENF